MEIQKPPSKEARLNMIISNIERQQNHVKSRIIETAKRKRKLSAVEHGVEAMDVDGPRGRALPSQHPTMEQMLAAMNTPYTESMGDPYLRPDATLPPPPPGTRQVTPPPEIKLAKETLDQIELYEKHASRTRNFFKAALQRERRRNSTGGSAASAPWNVRRTSSASASAVRGATSPNRDPRRVNASPIDISRDPRLQRRDSRP
ncbi:uncharacterized protein MYCFIDRAFT_202365 [Pseudocercospora fijiensis CIRAD86]|uniref:Uncharacterized protein n=1 Tax=Pseudocercospora fijiensis (strain CIRAD86) TaxID=383855 RepID=M3B9W9_PSEFD|nr:uncharacterized protein MYCFIDRAFT_202365 [Pseudocercospora fijiensis CIRAD86]EME86053.1 hypothetical protein MYCFIDRAFT_202365 [Pseudocercospora fijiensis CIRAD86]